MGKVNLLNMETLVPRVEIKNTKRNTEDKARNNAPVAQWIEQRTSNP